MNTTHLNSSTPERIPGRRGRRLAMIALAGATLTLLAPVPGVDAGPLPVAAARACGNASAATYTVAAGDSWSAIAAAAKTSTTSLLRANDAKASAAIYPGDVLCLPSGATTPSAPVSQSACASKRTVVRGDSWSKISQSAGVSLQGLLEANGATVATVLQPGVVVCLPKGAAPASALGPPARACVSKRVVAAGESWYVISRTTGVPIDALVAANDATRSSAIFPGQSLCLPEVGFGRELPSVLLDAAPVRGSCRFANSWQASRDSGRSHQGVDLISPAGTPVIAAATGTLTKQTTGAARSGNAWWLTTSSGTYFFYAHLSSFAGGLSVGSNVQAGDVIGYVGSTGNAVSPHLHFEIHPGGGSPINPYSAIWMVGGCAYDRRYEQTPLS